MGREFRLGYDTYSQTLVVHHCNNMNMHLLYLKDDTQSLGLTRTRRNFQPQLKHRFR